MLLIVLGLTLMGLPLLVRLAQGLTFRQGFVDQRSVNIICTTGGAAVNAEAEKFFRENPEARYFYWGNARFHNPNFLYEVYREPDPWEPDRE